MTKADYTYFAFTACGCCEAAVVDMPDASRFVAKSVADFIRRGLTVQRLLHAEGPPIRRCIHHRVAKQQSLELVAKERAVGVLET